MALTHRNPSAARGDMTRVAATLDAATRQLPGLGWYTVAAVPNGRYWIDHDTGLVYVDGRLSADGYVGALLDAVAELAATAQIIPMPRRTRRGS